MPVSMPWNAQYPAGGLVGDEPAVPVGADAGDHLERPLAGTMPWMSNWPASKFCCLRAFSGPDHQVTRAATAPPQAAAASSIQPALTASQCLRVTLCIQANWLVPVSSSRATSGPPQNTPSRHGTTKVSVTRSNSTGVPSDSEFARLPQLLLAAHEARAE